ncbi:hypothetical protein N5U19_04540 [Aliarcobacter butzleri]|uniref:hypothetical protein n=1 Tax=Aliarcobacter butzleri TaxID=28197 RepID=UPI0021B5E1CA|nr:hypothetical protein [Aliarcobacter butzleri]MCT7650144.1 hypothetical protein [Aliarcobacter butzleri]
MNKILKNKKTQRQIGFYQNEIDLINSIAASSKNDFSNTVRELVIKGLENAEIAESLADNVKFSVGKIERKYEDFDKKIMKILMLLLKQTAISKAYLENFNEAKTGKSREEYFNFLDKLEVAAIKRMFERLKEEEK